MGRRRRHKHKHKNVNNNQNHQCNDGKCKGHPKQEQQAEVVEIESQMDLKELLDLIMEHGERRSRRVQAKQHELSNALLEDAGITVSVEKPNTTKIVIDDDSAI